MSHNTIIAHYSPLALKKSKPGAEAVYIPEYWKNLDTYLNKNGRYIKKIPGDGFCLLSSILACLQNDHKIDISIENAKQLILEQQQQKIPLLRTNCESLITLYVVNMHFSRENVDKINLQGF